MVPHISYTNDMPEHALVQYKLVRQFQGAIPLLSPHSVEFTLHAAILFYFSLSPLPDYVACIPSICPIIVQQHSAPCLAEVSKIELAGASLMTGLGMK